LLANGRAVEQRWRWRCRNRPAGIVARPARYQSLAHQVLMETAKSGVNTSCHHPLGM
jgi:hypothetical protein